MIDNFDDQIFELKKKFSQLQRQRDHVDHLESVSQVSGTSKKSSEKVRGLVSGLEAEQIALLSAQEKEVEATARTRKRRIKSL